MLYQAELTIPANTSQDAAVETTLQLVRGRVNQIEVLFPPGCSGLAHLQIYHKSFLIWPSSPDESLFGDSFPIRWAEDFPMSENPYQLRLVGWNFDNLYEHTVTVRAAMLSEVDTLTDYLKKLILPSVDMG